MRAAATRPLTQRQQSVMDRIDRRVPIKVIAAELGVSETRVNQHIRVLKDIYRAESLNELVEIYRSGDRLIESPTDATPLRKSAYSKKQIELSDRQSEKAPRNDLHGYGGEDEVEAHDTPRTPDEPQVVPGVLDGENAVLLRLGIVVAIAFGILAAVVLAVTAAMTLSEALDGRASVPVEN